MSDDLDLAPIPASTVGAEGEDDLRKSELARLHDTVVGAADWTTETILSQLERGNIDLGPVFQRRDAWEIRRKSRFIESIILNLPIPQLVLAEHPRRKGSYIVIDGKQRLLTLKQFAAKPGTVPEPIKLRGLTFRSDLNGKSLRDLETDLTLVDDLRAFQNMTIRTVVIRGWPNESVLYLIFLRLNTGSLPLSPQELRTALHPGPFVTFVNEVSPRVEGFRTMLGLRGPDFRMRDAELLLRYYAFSNFLPTYRGNLKDFLDLTCVTLNEEWPIRLNQIHRQLADLEAAISATFHIFETKYAFRKWDGASYERRFNRAVFDVMVYFFRMEPIRQAALQNAATIKVAFETLCELDHEFVRSVESTTKSLRATAYRLSSWAKALSSVLNLQITAPLVGEPVEGGPDSGVGEI